MKAATQVEKQPRNVIKVKTALPKTKTRGDKLMAEEDAALLEPVEEHCHDFDRIIAEYGARLGGRKANALYHHFCDHHPKKFRDMREATPRGGGICLGWTAEEDEALKRGRRKHGSDWEKIHETESEVLGHRSVKSLQNRYYNKI